MGGVKQPITIWQNDAGRIAIAVSRNPWHADDGVHLGHLVGEFGGGGIAPAAT
jgi:hypothetical protein